VTASESAVPTSSDEIEELRTTGARVRHEQWLCVFRVAIVREKRRELLRSGSEQPRGSCEVVASAVKFRTGWNDFNLDWPSRRGVFEIRILDRV